MEYQWGYGNLVVLKTIEGDLKYNETDIKLNLPPPPPTLPATHKLIKSNKHMIIAINPGSK